MDIDEFVAKWRKKQGSQFIATHKFLAVLREHLEDSEGIVDFGAGIGTISGWAKANNRNIRILAIEPNEWCRREFLINLEKFEGIELIESLRNCDSVNPKGWTWIVDMAFEAGDSRRILQSDPKAIFVEGHRYHQRLALLIEILARGLNYSYTSFAGDKQSEKGGCYFLPSKGRRLTLLWPLLSAFILHLWFRSLHTTVSIANRLGLGKGAKTRG